MSELKYDPEFPFVVRSLATNYASARFAKYEAAERWARDDEFLEIVDTTPKPKIPDDAEFILVETEDVAKDIYQRVEDKHEDAGFYWYRAIDSMAYGHYEMPDMIGDAEVTVLVRKEDA